MRQLDFLELLERPTLEALAQPDQIFEAEDWKFIARLPENTRFDRKSGRVDARKLAESLSAFGNGPAVEGGVVAIGIENDGRIVGCNALSTEKIQALESMGRDHCLDARFKTRRLECLNENGETDFLILAKIDYVEERLVELTNGEAYCRESDKSRKLTEAEKQEIRINKGERAFELEPCPLDYPDDFRLKQISQFAQKIRNSRGASSDITDEEIMESMRLGKIRGGSFIPNNVAALMFAKDPQHVFAGSYIHFLRYEGTYEGTGKDYNVTKDRIIEGTILDIIKDAANTLDASLRDFTEFRNGKFSQVPEYPHDAWYELIVNAVVHRSYHAKTQPIFLKMFDDHLVVENPGGFMPAITPDNFFHKPRNRFLMFAVREFGEVRCISEGTRRIRREMSDAKLPPVEYEDRGHTVVARLRNNIAYRTNSLDSEAYKVLGDAVAFSLDPDERRIINYLAEHKAMNVGDALRILSTTNWHTAKGKLSRLQKRGILEFITTKTRDPNAHYVIRKRVDQ